MTNITPIKTDADYRAALKEVASLMTAEPNTPEGEKLDILVTLIEAYEHKHFPCASPDPAMNLDKSFEEKKYDYEGYAESLEQILDGATKDYWTSYVDISRHQLNVSRTYLWVSAALLGIYGAAYEKFYENLLNSNLCLIALSLISFILCGIGFGMCLYAIPAREGYKPIYDIGWGEFSKQAYDLLEKERNKEIYISFLTSLIAKVDSAIKHNVSTNLRRAKQLRFTSWFLIVSFLIAIIVALSVTIMTLTYSTKEKTAMNDTNKEIQAQNREQNTEQRPNVPIPPPPAEIISKGSNTLAMDGVEVGTITTESNKRK